MRTTIKAKMKKIAFFLCLLVLFSIAQAQKVINDPNAEPRKVEAFEGVSVSGGIDLYLSYGDEVIAVSASKPEYRDRIKTEVKNGVLKIWYDSKSGINLNFTNEKALKAYVSYKTLKSLGASGGSDIVVDGSIKGNELKMDFSGGSDFKGKVELTSLIIHQSGGSDVNISGKVSNLTVDASGGSDFNGYDLMADVCNLEASGGCDIEVTANKELSAQASGASDIHYKGKPAIRQARASGASSIGARS